MSLVVSQSAPAAPAAPVAGTSLKWLWGAVGALGLSVVALGAALVVQTQRLSEAPQASVAPQVAGQEQALPLASGLPVAAGLPVASAVQYGQKVPPAQYQQAQVATSSGAYSTPRPPQAGAAPRAPLATTPALERAPLCATCGRVESVQAVQQAAPATGVGAVAGGVLGAVVGNQVGKGSGRTAATVLGAVGGGYVGHKVEERTRTQTVYQVAVRMEDGSLRRFQRSQPPAVGTPVVLQGNGFRTADERYAAPPQQRDAGYHTVAQPGHVLTQ